MDAKRGQGNRRDARMDVKGAFQTKDTPSFFVTLSSFSFSFSFFFPLRAVPLGEKEKDKDKEERRKIADAWPHSEAHLGAECPPPAYPSN
ncbi:MAG: hypothetical protein LBI02_10600 [Opitutaceae bacterium]|jgi:hypothetical protein|nr:hypothetical protein [Opitutaceae bacterium]